MNPSLSAGSTLNNFMIHFDFVPFLRVQSENMGKKCCCGHRLTTEYHYLITLQRVTSLIEHLCSIDQILFCDVDFSSCQICWILVDIISVGKLMIGIQNSNRL